MLSLDVRMTGSTNESRTNVILSENSKDSASIISPKHDIVTLSLQYLNSLLSMLCLRE